jgi:predicted amidohydrolase
MSGDIGMNVKIAFIQLLPEHSLDKNLEIGKNACIEAKEMGADIALFPEMWSDGYYLPQDETELKLLGQQAFMSRILIWIN